MANEIIKTAEQKIAADTQLIGELQTAIIQAIDTPTRERAQEALARFIFQD